MQDFKKLKAWQKCHGQDLDIFKIAGSFPKYELPRWELEA